MALLNSKEFFAHVRSMLYHGFMNQSEVDGINSILDSWDNTAPNSDIRFVADSLGQCYHETAYTMQPISEYGKGEGRPYGVKNKLTGQIYYGRGLIQLTWLSNYQKATNELFHMGLLQDGESLVTNADLALRPDIAAAIMIHGMLEGWFTGKSLKNFFDAKHTDFFHSRQIINGMDRAFEISQFSQQFLSALQLGGYK